MENMPKVEQQTLLQSIRNTAQSGRELIRENFVEFVAVTATVAALAATVELVAPEPVSAKTPNRSAPTFEPGTYVGMTSQICPSPAADVGLCIEGEKIPVSFIATPNKIIDFHTAAITACYAGESKIGKGTFSLDVKQTKLNTKHQFTVAELENPGTAQTAVRGSLHGAKAEGDLGFAVHLDNQGQRGNEGNKYCQSDVIDFDAERVG